MCFFRRPTKRQFQQGAPVFLQSDVNIGLKYAILKMGIMGIMGIIWDLCPALPIAPDDDTKRTDYTSHEQLSLISGS